MKTSIINIIHFICAHIIKEVMYVENQEKQGKQPKNMNGFASTVASIGFYGGFIWGLIHFITYYLNLTKIGPAFILNPWAFGEWKNQLLGQVIGVFAISLISIGVAFFYRVLFAKFKSIILSLIFGAGLWALIFYFLNPVFPDVKPLSDLDKNTIVTTGCIFLLYGLFVGYSISFHYDEITNETTYSKD